MVSLTLVGAGVAAFSAPNHFGSSFARTSGPIMSSSELAPAGTNEAPLMADVKKGVVVPTGNGNGGVQSWYDAGVRLSLTGEAAATRPPVVAAPQTAAKPADAVPEPVPKPAAPKRRAVWNPSNLDTIPAGPLGTVELKSFCVPEYLKEAPAYLDGTLPGDNGFDPLCLMALSNPLNLTPQKVQYLRTAAQRHEEVLGLDEREQQAKLAWMRESELKHGRLAMLAAAGWPLAELGPFVHGRAPSLFNGGLFEFGNFVFVALAFGGVAYLETETQETAKGGDYGFDPLGFATGKGALPTSVPNVGDLETLRLAEVKNGRLAMMAITGMSVQEFLYGSPVVDQTPWFFGK
jgi:hypothetical protein